MAISYGVNVEATINSTKKKSKFVNIAADETLRLRFMPPTNPGGSLFMLHANHFKLEDGDRKVAPACNNEHADGGCFLCKLSWFLKDNGDKGEKKISEDIRRADNWYAPVSVATKDANGEWVYAEPKLMRFSKTGTEAVTAILKAQQLSGDDFFTCHEKGQDIFFSRAGAGFNTKYSAVASGMKSALDDIMPGWEDKLISDVWQELDPRFKTNDEMKALAVGTFPNDIDWDKVEEHLV